MNATSPFLKKNSPIFWAVAFIILMSNFAKAELPQAVSLDICADQYLLSLAERSQIIAVSTWADSENSYYRSRAADLNKIAGTVEEVLNIKPDVVIGSDRAFMVLPALKFYGIETNTPAYGHDAKILFKNLKDFGDALGRSVQAEKIIFNYKKRLQSLQSLPRSEIKIAYITPSGFTGGEGTYINDIIKLAGFSSYAQDRQITGWQPISLEQFLLSPPDLIVSSFFDDNEVHVSHWSLTRHPKINQVMNQIPTISIPGDLISCGGLFSIEIAEYINEFSAKILKDQAINEKGHNQ